MSLTLLIFRHAKSDWSTAELDDHERPLNPRGMRSAPIIGHYLRRHKLLPDQVLCSTATRARQTWELAANKIDQDITCNHLSELYDFGLGDGIIDVVRRHGGTTKRLMLVGHNPALHNAAMKLISKGPKKQLQQLTNKFPTSALCEIKLNIDHWPHLTPACGELVRYVFPKALAKHKN